MFGYNFFGCPHFAGVFTLLWEAVDELTATWTRSAKPTTTWTKVWEY